MKLILRVGGKTHEVETVEEGDGVRVLLDGRPVHVSIEGTGPLAAARIDGRRVGFGVHRRDDRWRILLEGAEIDVETADPLAERARAARRARVDGRTTEVRAPIPGLVTRVLGKPGRAVSRGEAVLRLDAMKLENEIESPRDGVLRSVAVREGQAVEKGQVLFVVG